ncbi:hypothetical protein NA57DRAFT_80572 [Rhizodiscina lignyota]|uniref:Uncharacterized protein n=1 Tax=Rhizodiscina lignyota TaxID=1504668 RepID=A0A9P4I7I5_9PEZI|nr:hypothetical protein NA57DRAFT_80572 [Rhizodiscina lignyota]
MPTPIDRAIQSRASRNAFLGFAGIVAATAAWAIWGSNSMFPEEEDPKGGLYIASLRTLLTR